MHWIGLKERFWIECTCWIGVNALIQSYEQKKYIRLLIWIYKPYVLSLQFSCTELVIQWTIFCHIVDARISASEKDLPVSDIFKNFKSRLMHWICSCKIATSIFLSWGSIECQFIIVIGISISWANCKCYKWNFAVWFDWKNKN